MSNTITLELCAEDRARLDRLAEALERKACEKCVSTALEAYKAQEKTSTPAEAPKTPVNEAEAKPAPIDHPAAESLPWGDAAPTTEAKQTVTLEQIQQKVTQLAAADRGAKKAKVREIVNTYAPKVSDLPEDKWADVWDKLTALEKEA